MNTQENAELPETHAEEGDSCPPPCSACGQEWYEGVESECIKRSRCGFRVTSKVTLRDVLIVMSADMLMTGEMPPEDVSDWAFSKSTTRRDRVKVIGHARRSREQCRKWAIRLREIADSLPNNQDQNQKCEFCNEAPLSESEREYMNRNFKDDESIHPEPKPGTAEQPTGERLDETPCSAWRDVKTAPRDGTEIVVYCPPAHGLNHMASVCAWHEDAGFCVCELREPTLWIPMPNSQDQEP